MSISSEVEVDIWRLEDVTRRTVPAADASGDHPELDPMPALDLTAELLPGWNEDWIALERERLRELCLHLIEARAIRFAAEGNFLGATTAAYDAVRADPLRESAVRTLVEVQLAEGNGAQAARSFLDFRQRLVRDAGIEPSQDLRALVARLLEPNGR